MATQKTETKSNENMTKDSGERKLYPMTEEIYERGEKVFWETFEKRMAELKAEKGQNKDQEGV